MLDQTKPEAQADGVRHAIDDNSLTPVPAHERKSGWYLSWLPAGVATSLLQLTLAGTITALVGSAAGLLAGVLVAAFVLAIGWLFGNIARVEGLSGTVLPRFHGLGVRGSALSSLAFAIMIIGFCASENVLLYNGTLFALGWEDSIGTRLLVYGVLTAAWIVLSMFGIKVVTRTSSALVIVFLLLLAYMVFRIYDTSQVTLGEAFAKAATVTAGSGTSRFFEVIGILGGQGAALILVNADYTRYARSRASVGGVNLVGVIMLDLVGIALGVLVLTGGSSLAGDYLVAHGQASPGGAAAAAAALATTNTGAYFVIVSGVVGFVLMYVAQAKVQVLNVYSGSLALANLWHVLTGRTPNRFVMILVANAVCLLLIAAGVFSHLSGFISVLGMIMMGIIATAIADYYVVARRERRSRDLVEPVNWAGVVTVATASLVSYVLSETGVFPFGFLSATVLCLVLYPLARTSVLKPKTVSHD
ncbi:purine-cytosine permease family protein [Amycolatopsis jiangsuensis]|uniref:Cytosine permease n=1 Tax=Amycolatopsis jiangsuensis TaxID=1181879 RepID=A0A840IR75_9PSEU|nr:cytosine permease [Amycolatopsis jiangsuensis]MBB4683877.1 cytosine permease [Amycolatopsis jiangsuensis]